MSGLAGQRSRLRHAVQRRDSGLVEVTTRLAQGAVQWRFDGDGADLGTFEGYANLHGVADSYGTNFRRGAWEAGGLDTEPYALLWMHDPWTVVGSFTAREDDQGLYVQGRFDQTPEGQTARARAQSGSARELSVGFSDPVTDDDDDLTFTSARLVEVSLITARHAAQPGAAVTSARAAQDEARATAARRRERQRVAAALRLR